MNALPHFYRKSKKRAKVFVYIFAARQKNMSTLSCER